MIITIDGPIATGKSTIAKKLAEEIGYIYFDTGAMYRCVTYGVIKKGINPADPQQMDEFLKNFHFDLKIKRGDRFYFYEDEDITKKIRSQEVTDLVSQISALKAVRDKLVALQQHLAQGVNAVFEGRDMGTVVFPQAQVKVFLVGNPEVRAQRRFQELKLKFPSETQNLTFEKVLADITDRDDSDMHREISPLRQAPEAIVIDTSDLTLEEIVFKILEFKDSMMTRLKTKPPSVNP